MRMSFLRSFLLASFSITATLAIIPCLHNQRFAAQAQSAPGTAPMTLSGLTDALRKNHGELPPSQFVQTIQHRGVSFQVTASAEKQLQQAGATPDIIQAARANFRGAPVPTPTHPDPSPHSLPAPPPKQDPTAAWAEGYGLYLAKNYSQALPLFQTACDGGELRGCGSLGFMYANGLGINPDFPKAISLLNRACNGTVPESCYVLGQIYFSGVNGYAQDHSKASSYFRKACDAGFPMGCNDLGAMYYNGVGLPPDHTQGRSLWQKACTAGVPISCNNLNVYPQ